MWPSALKRIIGVSSPAICFALVASAALAIAPNVGTSPQTSVYRIDRVVDGDTVRLRNGATVRLVQIDTPEVFFGNECYGRQASATAKRLLPSGARVRLELEPETDRVDDYGRLLRYVIRAKDGVNVNVALVAVVRELRTTRTAASRLAVSPLDRRRPSWTSLLPIIRAPGLRQPAGLGLAPRLPSRSERNGVRRLGWTKGCANQRDRDYL